MGTRSGGGNGAGGGDKDKGKRPAAGQGGPAPKKRVAKAKSTARAEASSSQDLDIERLFPAPRTLPRVEGEQRLPQRRGGEEGAKKPVRVVPADQLGER